MTKTVLLLLLMLVLTPVYSQFNEKIAWKSLVRVQSGNNVQSGFLWKDNSLIVTALHGMQPNSKILIYYPNGSQSPADVIRVYKEGDLVLLKAIRPPALTAQVAPITSFNEVVRTGEELTATGFYGGAQAKTTQSFKKGAANPETIRAIAPPNLAAEVNKIQYPNINFNIYFVSGSLLPGYSGCPVFNSNMELVAIGDGGLDKGQLNISWCVPAKNIIQLENSSVTSLPGDIQVSNLSYTSDVNTSTTSNTNANGAQQYRSFTSGNFNFYLTKTRTWKEMYLTTSNPDNMDELIKLFEEIGIHLDYELFDFDIYEDVLNGFVLVVPEGSRLEANPNEPNSFKVKVSNLLTDDYDYFELNYFFIKHQGETMSYMIDKIRSNLSAYEPDGISIDSLYNVNDIFTNQHTINKEWGATYLMFFPNFKVYLDIVKKDVIPLYYVSSIDKFFDNNGYSFKSVGIAHFPTEREGLWPAFETGLNCIGNNYDNNMDVCDFLEAYMRIVASVQLTTIVTD